MKGKSQKNKRKSEMNAMFFIILIAAVMFIISTYAWFSTQKNVSITNLQGIVQVAEGLEISLDGLNWSNTIVLASQDVEGKSIIDDAYSGHHNISPSEMLPVSTLGLVSGSTMTDIKMLRGKVTNSQVTSLSDIVAMDESVTDATSAKFPGYFAFDVFLKNSSKQTDVDDVLQLNYDSSLQLLDQSKDTTGLQNTVRVAFAKYDGTSDVMADQTTILKETAGIGVGATQTYITDIAIWEPNSNDHADYIVKNNNKIKWSSADATKYATKTLEDGTSKGFDVNTQMPTYALKESTENSSIDNIYVWDGTESKLQKQVTLQTTKTSSSDYTISEGVQNLISTSDTGDKSKTFGITPNRISRIRVYVWLEGQDVDCINYASYGGGIKLNIGLVKGSVVGTTEPTGE